MTILILGLYALTLLALFALSLRNAGACLGGVIIMYALQQMGQSVTPILVNHSWLCNTMIGMIVAAAFASAVLRDQKPLRDYPIHGVLSMLLLFQCLLSTCWSYDAKVTILTFAKYSPYLVLTILVAPLTLHNSRQVNIGLVTTLVFGTLVLACIMATGNFEGRGVQVAGDESYEANPLALGSVGGYVAIIAAMLNRPKGGVVWFTLRWMIVLLGMYVIFRGESRGQVIGTFLAGLVMLPISRPISSGRGFFGVVAGIVIIIAVTGFMFMRSTEKSQRFTAGAMVDSMEQSRVADSKAVLAKWLSMPQYWLVGYGSSASMSPKVIGFYPHVVPVEVLCEEGLLGFGLFAAIMGLSFRSIIRSMRHIGDSPVLRGHLACLGGLFLITFVLCFKQGSLMGSPYLLGFAIMLGRFELIVAREAEPQPAVSYGLVPQIA